MVPARSWNTLFCDLAQLPVDCTAQALRAHLVARIGEAGVPLVLLAFPVSGEKVPGAATCGVRDGTADSAYVRRLTAALSAPLVMEDQEQLGGWSYAAPWLEAGAMSVVALPLTIDGRRIGCLALGFWQPWRAAACLDDARLLAAQVTLLIRLNRAEARVGFHQPFFDHASDALFLTTPDGAVEAANPAACRMLGRGEHELRRLGRVAIVDEEDPRLAKALEERDRTGRFFGELALRRADGSTFPAELSCSVFSLPDGTRRASIIARDISVRRHAEQAIARPAAALASFFDSSPFMMGLLDREGDDFRHIADNEAVAHFIGRPRGEICGRLSSELGVPGETIRRWLQYCERSRRQGYSACFDYESSRSGRRRWLSVTVSHMGAGAGGCERYSYVIEDVTDRKEAERRASRLHAMYIALSRTNRAVAFRFDQEALLQDVCSIAAECAGFPLASIAMIDALGEMRLAAHSGDVDDGESTQRALEAEQVLRREGCSKWQAVGAGETSMCNDWQQERALGACREISLCHEFRSSVAVPLRSEGSVVGAFSVYSRQPHAFDEELVNVLEEMAAVVSFGLESLERDRKRRGAEAALRRSEEQLRRLLDTCQEGVWTVDRAARTTYMNARMTKLLGYSWSETAGRPLFDFMDQAWANGARALFARRLDDHASEVRDFCFRRKDGSALWTILSTSPIVDPAGAIVGALAMVTDITARKQADDALRESQALLTRVMNLVPVIIYLLDVQTQRAVWVNGAMEAITGYSTADIQQLGSKVMETLLHPDDLRQLQQLYERWGGPDGGEVIEYDSRVRTRSGEWIHVSVREVVFSRDENGRPRQILGVAKDITARVRLEEAEARKLADVARMGRLVTMGEMASALAHELNQPLTAIANFAQGCLNHLRSGQADRELLETGLGKAVTQTLRAGAVLQTVREFVRKRDANPGPMDINDVVSQVVSLAQIRSRGQAVEYRLSLDAALPPLWADRILVEQVLMNLIRNAEEAMDERAEAVVRIQTAPGEEGYVVVSILDNGRGLPPGFDMDAIPAFYTTKADGMGVGLNICRGIVEASGGRIWVESPAGETAFRFTLPIAPPAAAY